MGNTAIKSRLNVVMTLSNNKSRLISCNPPPNDYFKHLSNNLWISESGVLTIVIDPQKINICKTLPRRKLALLVSRTGSVGLSISWSDSRLISKSRDFPDLGGWTRPGVFCEAR